MGPNFYHLSHYSTIAKSSRLFSNVLSMIKPVTHQSAIMAMSKQFTIDVFKPPANIGPSNLINRDAFSKTAIVPALQINKKQIHKVLKAFKSATFERPKFQVIREVPTNQDEKFFLLDPQKLSSLESVTELQRAALAESGVEEKLHEYQLALSYKDWQAHEVLQSLLPSDVEVPTGFSRIGHIIHLNLRDHQLEHKFLIGEVLLEKNPGVKTVVNKLNAIDNTYRFFSMERIAGEPDTVVTVKEHHASYSFDFAKVYWNPRLSTEHHRIVDKLAKTDVVYDMFAGVGPFAIPAAKKGCKVLANDLNPESFQWLEHNAKKNKVSNKVTASNLDARQFVKDVMKLDLTLRAQERFQHRAHIIMNLPAIAVEFLDAFPGLLGDLPSKLQGCIPDVIVHCHGFSTASDPAEDIRARVEGVLGCRLESPEIHDVRDVAPNKEMMCISFNLPSSLLCSTLPSDSEKSAAESSLEEGAASIEEPDEPATKRPKAS